MVYLFLADGFEEVEALTPLDYLRRAGVPVQSVGVTGPVVTGSHQISIQADIGLDEVDFDAMTAIILPGGMPGTKNLEQNETVQKAIDCCVEKNLLIGAICAAPSILGHKGILEGKTATCFPGFEQELAGAKLSRDPACVDGQIVTSRGAGAAQQFAFALIEKLAGLKQAEHISEQVQW